MQISARADYAIRALVELHARGGGPVTGEVLAEAQQLPPKFLEGILTGLRQRELLHSRRGTDGGYWLARPGERISVADIIRATEGPLASVRGVPPDEVSYQGPAEALAPVWVALRQNLRSVLEGVSIADLVTGELPEEVRRRASHPEARTSRIR
ncbi:MAG: Rrf2 family transcriptional regulator [Acidimicrobiaceae bacterium]|nr:Rrf2 family transcriptional regulator [Acidimicrobiaceae bacterium]